jgi:1,4-alpha-glucan branching enzyme
MSEETTRIGAHPNDHSCFFRVWAPHASTLKVLIQDGGTWDHGDPGTRTVDLARSDNGYWSGTVPNVGPGHLYRYQITIDGHSFQRLDPAARDVLHSGLTRHFPDSENASIVVTDEPYGWSPYTTPRFKDFLIYQLHVGSFAGRNDGIDKKIATFADIEAKLDYLHRLNFNAIELLPIQEFAMSRSWGYNPASFFAPESAYGSPADLKHFVDAAHQHGLAMIFDVVYNHAGPGDNVLWEYDGYTEEGGIYFEDGRWTDWGRGPAWHKREVQDFFFENARMYFEDYNADGLRFDVTTQIDGNYLKEVLWRLQSEYPGKYMIAEHLPAHPWITTTGNFDATWLAKSHHEAQRALNGDNPVGKIKGILGWDGFDHPWNLVKYTMGSHDDIGDDKNGNAEDGLTSWDKRHRYFVDQLGGRENWHARAKCRLAWALNVAMPGTPMMFMGSECHMASPFVSWGYWHDGKDNNGDHRFNWDATGDSIGKEMRRLVSAANQVRSENPALASESLIITHEDWFNRVIGFKRWADGNLVLTVVNMGNTNFRNHSYGLSTDNQYGEWTQVLCTQDASFGGWAGAGNAFYDPWTQQDGRIYINLPKWSLVMFRLK